MNEIYWLSRLDNLLNVLVAVMVFGIVALVIIYFVRLVEEYSWDELKKWVRMSVIAIILSAIGLVFIPSTNEALLIWGVGGTIDYIQDSDKLRELPDKCVEALDLWIESITENE